MSLSEPMMLAWPGCGALIMHESVYAPLDDRMTLNCHVDSWIKHRGQCFCVICHHLIADEHLPKHRVPAIMNVRASYPKTCLNTKETVRGDFDDVFHN